VLIQNPRAKTMDGKNGRFIKFHQRSMDQISSGQVIVLALQQILQKMVLISPPVKGHLSLPEFCPYPITQLFGGGFGKCDDQDLINRQLLFQDESQEQCLNGVCFTGSGTGFNKTGTFQRGIDEVKGFQIFMPC
jgi:hypothetical protein